MNLEREIGRRLAPAFAAAMGEPVEPVVRRSQHADFQCDSALALAKRRGGNPRALAQQVLDRSDVADLCSRAEVSGPGFLNFTIRDDVLSRAAAQVAGDDRLGIPTTARPEIITVDYSAPNAAKEMHVGHLRSTIIGDAAVRLLEWLGHRVIKQNHIGEWGTPFGMLIEHLLDLGEAEAAHELSVGDLDSFYKAARQKFDTDPAFQERSRKRVVLLQSGDPTTRRLWEILVNESKKYFLAVYERLDVRLGPDDFYGESCYNDQLPSLIEELDRLGLLEWSEGARCVFPPSFTNREGERLPLIVQKSDGGFGYAATDLATIRHRIRNLKATRLLYVVGLPQRQHLEMIFAVARQAGWLVPPVRAEHIGHGSVLGPDGRMLRSRAGHSIKLIELLDEAVARASAIIAEKNPGLDAETRAAIARAVGIGAVKYADLSTDRTRDYIFDYDRMLSFDGNTAPYLQYAHARIRSIFRKAGIEANRGLDRILLAAPEERALVLELLSLDPNIDAIEESLEFHRLAAQLYAVATAFTSFYERCPVLRADGELRDSRLLLCDLTARTLALGLDLLGIRAPDEM